MSAFCYRLCRRFYGRRKQESMKKMLWVTIAVAAMAVMATAQYPPPCWACAGASKVECVSSSADGHPHCNTQCIIIDMQCYPICTSCCGICETGGPNKPAGKCNKSQPTGETGAALLKDYPWLNHEESQDGKLMLAKTSEGDFHYLMAAFVTKVLKEGPFDSGDFNSVSHTTGNKLTLEALTDLGKHVITLNFYSRTPDLMTFPEAKAINMKPVETLVIGKSNWTWTNGKEVDSGAVK